MRRRKPFAYRLGEADRRYVQAILADGQIVQRVAKRARALLALDCGERLVAIAHWLGWSRMRLWHLWQRYQQCGAAAIWDAERSGRPPVFSPLKRVQIERAACADPAAYGLHIARWDCRSLQQVVVERAIVDSIYYTTIARIWAAASLQPHRSRYWKTATVDAQFTTRAAKILWRYERAAWLYERGEVVLCLDEKPNMQAPARCVPAQSMRPGQIGRREFEYTRHGAVTFPVSFNVYDGTMWGCYLEANDHEHFLRALGRLARRYPQARRLHLIMDNGWSHSAHATQAYFASHPRLQVFYTPPHASWLN
jgi:DDE superfamily endonuclease/Homeodomain-like domain